MQDCGTVTNRSSFLLDLLLASDACQRCGRQRKLPLHAHRGLSLGLGVSRHQPVHLRLQEQAIPTGIHKGD